MATRNYEQFTFGSFDASETTSAGYRWKKYLLRFDNMMEAYDITDHKRQKALLHHAGEDVFNIYCTFEGYKNLTFEETCQKMSDYFHPKKCVEFEIHKFRKCSQKENETIDSYNTRLQSLAENCEFDNKDKEIKMQIIHKCKSDRLRKKALQQSMNLEEILSLERSMEIASLHAAEMSSKDVTVNKISSKKKSNNANTSNEKRTRFRCGKAGLTMAGAPQWTNNAVTAAN